MTKEKMEKSLVLDGKINELKVLVRIAEGSSAKAFSEHLKAHRSTDVETVFWNFADIARKKTLEFVDESIKKLELEFKAL